MSAVEKTQARYHQVREAAGYAWFAVYETACQEPAVLAAEADHSAVHPDACHGCELGATATEAFLDAVETLVDARPTAPAAPVPFPHGGDGEALWAWARFHALASVDLVEAIATEALGAADFSLICDDLVPALRSRWRENHKDGGSANVYNRSSMVASMALAGVLQNRGWPAIEWCRNVDEKLLDHGTYAVMVRLSPKALVAHAATLAARRDSKRAQRALELAQRAGASEKVLAGVVRLGVAHQLKLTLPTKS